MKSKIEKYQGNRNQTKSWSFEKMDKIVKPVVGVAKMKKKRHNQYQEIQQVGGKNSKLD